MYEPKCVYHLSLTHVPFKLNLAHFYLSQLDRRENGAVTQFVGPLLSLDCRARLSSKCNGTLKTIGYIIYIYVQKYSTRKGLSEFVNIWFMKL